MKTIAISDLFPINNDIALNKINDFYQWLDALPGYKNIYIVANSRMLSDIEFPASNKDLLVIFNYYNQQWVQQHRGDIAVFNRQSDEQPVFHRHYVPCLDNASNVKQFALCNSYRSINIEQAAFLNAFDGVLCTDFIPYPNKNKKWLCPSSGFTVFKVIYDRFKQHQVMARIHMVGFEFAGYALHDWEYEKQQAAVLDFYSQNNKDDNFLT